MNHIAAIGFDLFNTLITLKPSTLNAAMGSMIHSLRDNGFPLKDAPFIDAYEQALDSILSQGLQPVAVATTADAT